MRHDKPVGESDGTQSGQITPETYTEPTSTINAGIPQSEVEPLPPGHLQEEHSSTAAGGPGGDLAEHDRSHGDVGDAAEGFDPFEDLDLGASAPSYIADLQAMWNHRDQVKDGYLPADDECLFYVESVCLKRMVDAVRYSVPTRDSRHGVIKLTLTAARLVL